MTVSVSKPALNFREELSALKKPSGVKGEELLRANTTSDVYSAIGQNRNIIINGAMEVAQRATSVTGLQSGNSNYYTIDRLGIQNGGSGTFRTSFDQVTDAPPGFNKSAKITVTTPLTGSTSATSYCGFYYVVEGYDIVRLGWGTTNPKPLTISFWVKSSIAGRYTHVGVRIDTASSGTYSCFTNIDINTANAWEYKTITIPGLTNGVTPSSLSNGAGIQIHINPFAGVGGAGTTNNLSWQAINALGTNSYVNDVRWIGTSGATFQITGLQAEVGTVATPFEYRSYQQELASCQRYYVKFSAADGNGGYATMFCGQISSTTMIIILPVFPVPLRTTNPIQTIGGGIRVATPNASFTVSSANWTANNQQISYTGGYGVWTHPSQSVISANQHVRIEGNNDTSAYWAFSAEL